jgi:hypothetical protein
MGFWAKTAYFGAMVLLTNAQIRVFKAQAQRLKATLKVGKEGQATWLRTKGNAAAFVTATMAMVLINSTTLKDFDRRQDGIVGRETPWRGFFDAISAVATFFEGVGKSGK